VGVALPTALGEACEDAEAYLAEFHDLAAWGQRAWRGRAEGFKIASEPLLQAWDRSLKQHSSVAYRSRARFYSAAYRLAEIAAAAGAKRCPGLAAFRRQRRVVSSVVPADGPLAAWQEEPREDLVELLSSGEAADRERAADFFDALSLHLSRLQRADRAE
ncbi:unnamed protein product, partial [Prorocentrum cordatum]